LLKAAPPALWYEKGKTSAAAQYPEFRAWHAMLEPLFGVTPPEWAEPAPDLELALPSCSWLAAVRLELLTLPLAVWQLGRGETEVIEYARLHGNLLVLVADPAALGGLERQIGSLWPQ
jgi:hypothetical protein